MKSANIKINFKTGKNKKMIRPNFGQEKNSIYPHTVINHQG